MLFKSRKTVCANNGGSPASRMPSVLTSLKTTPLIIAWDWESAAYVMLIGREAFAPPECVTATSAAKSCPSVKNHSLNVFPLP